MSVIVLPLLFGKCSLDIYDSNLFTPHLPGPALTACLEAYQAIRRLRTKSPPVERSHRRRHLCLVYVLASLTIGTYLANLYLAEGVIFRCSVHFLIVCFRMVDAIQPLSSERV